MDKFKIKRVHATTASFRSIQIRRDTYDAIKQMQLDSGAQLVDVMDQMVRFCAERLEIVEEDD